MPLHYYFLNIYYDTIVSDVCFDHFSALRLGGRFPYLWLATILHGMTVESISYFLPDIDNFWHAQSMVMLLGQRLPLHIIVLCTCQYNRFSFSKNICRAEDDLFMANYGQKDL